MTLDRFIWPRPIFLARVALFWLVIGGFAAISVPASVRADLLSDGAAAFAAGDYGEAAAAWRPLAEGGDPMAQFNMGLLHEAGRGVPADLPTAAQWYERAAKQGLGAAQYNLAVLYQTGRGVPEDLQRSLFWLEVVSQQGGGDEQRYATTAAAKLVPLLAADVVDATRNDARDFVPRKEHEAIARTGPGNLVLTPEQITIVQKRLSALGYDPGPHDGVPGPKTRRAVQNYLDDRGIDWRPDENLTQRLLEVIGQR